MFVLHSTTLGATDVTSGNILISQDNLTACATNRCENKTLENVLFVRACVGAAIVVVVFFRVGNR